MSERDEVQGRRRFLHRGEGEALLLALPPLTVALLAQALFELNAFNLVALGEQLASRLESLAAPDLTRSLALADDRAHWSLAVFLHLTSGLALTLVAAIILCRSVSLRGFRLFVPATLVLILLGLASLALAAAAETPISGLFSFTYGSLSALSGLPESFLLAVKTQVVLLNILSVVAPVSALMAACSTLAPPRDGAAADLAFLGGQVKWLKVLVVIGSIYMVTGVLHLGVWLRWPAVLVGSEALAAEIENHALAMSLYWGGAFTVLIAAFYVPAMVALNKRAEGVIDRLPKDSTGGLTPKKFLEDHGLSLQISKQLPQIAAVLAPLLAGPIGSAIVDVSHALPGAQ